VFTIFNDSSCALARQKQRSICFWLPFSLFLSFGQAKERKERIDLLMQCFCSSFSPYFNFYPAAIFTGIFAIKFYVVLSLRQDR
jgi:hypothetical protein